MSRFKRKGPLAAIRVALFTLVGVEQAVDDARNTHGSAIGLRRRRRRCEEGNP